MASEKLLAEWFWTDRWMGSSAFLLPLEPRGLYREMLTQAWLRGAQLPNDYAAIRRATGASQDEWDRCWPMIQRYWEVRDGHLINTTQLEVYEEAQGVRQRALDRGRNGGKASGRSRRSSNSSSTQVELKLKPLSLSLTDHSTEQSDPKRDRFERWWDGYPRKVGKDAAWREWLHRSPDDDLTAVMITAVEQQRASEQWLRDGGQFIPHPRTWLHQGRWQDEPVSSHSSQPSAVDWWDECKQLHAGLCNGRVGHANQMHLDAERARLNMSPHPVRQAGLDQERKAAS
jgi:uncharacterized protein YdaU (DUF1376 family)